MLYVVAAVFLLLIIWLARVPKPPDITLNSSDWVPQDPPNSHGLTLNAEDLDRFRASARRCARLVFSVSHTHGLQTLRLLIEQELRTEKSVDEVYALVKRHAEACQAELPEEDRRGFPIMVHAIAFIANASSFVVPKTGVADDSKARLFGEKRRSCSTLFTPDVQG